MLANDQHAVAEREALLRVVGNGGVESGVCDRDARRRGDDPANVLGVSIPYFDAERELRRNVVKVGVRQLAQQGVDAVIKVRGCAPKPAGFGAELFEQSQCVELAVVFGGLLTH